MSENRKKRKNLPEEVELSSGIYYAPVHLPLKIQHLTSQNVLWHRHKDFYELVIVCGGSARHVNQERSETIHAGHVFLMPERSAHRYLDQKNFRYYNVIFHPSLLKTEIPGVHLETLPGYHTLFDFQSTGENRCSRMLTVDEVVLAKLVPMLSELRSEIRNRRPGWQEGAYFLFMQIMVFLLRNGSPAESAAFRDVFPIGHAIRLMEQDCTQDFTIRKLAEASGTSPSCFRHNFTRITGLPPRAYLLALRIRRAILLLNGTETIGEVAVRSGFPDSNYFSRIVRDRLGLSPREIRRKYSTGELSPDALLDRLKPSVSGDLRIGARERKTKHVRSVRAFRGGKKLGA